MARYNMRAAGRTIRLRLDTQAWVEIEEEFGTLPAMVAAMQGDDKPTDAVLRGCAILARAGARHAGEDPALAPDAAWMRDNLAPKQVRPQLFTLALGAITTGLRRDDVGQEDEDVDVVAEEIAKKKDGN